MRADTLAGVARRIYHQEAGGTVGHAAVKRIARDRGLVAALSSGSPTALRAAALRQLFNPGEHVVRLSIVRGGQTLTDVGGAFVVAPATLPLHGAVLEASMQDVIGYVKLVHRLTGAQIVVRAPGHVESSLAAAAQAALPASGSVTVAGRTYEVQLVPRARLRGGAAGRLDPQSLSAGRPWRSSRARKRETEWAALRRAGVGPGGLR